jgi:uncharacterized membrane protein
MTQNDDIAFSVFKGLQRPIQFKGLKGSYIYFAFGIALGSLFVAIIVSTMTNFLTATFSMAIFVFGGIIGMALYQRKYGLYRKNINKGVFVIHNLFNDN